MMAYLTRRQKFSNGGDAILPQPNPLSPQERNQKVFDDYVGRMKKYLGAGVDMPEWFVKDLVTKKAAELGVELKAHGGRIKAGDGLSIQTLNPLFPTQDVDSDDFQPIDVPGAIIPPLAIGVGAKYLKDKFFKKDKDEEVSEDLADKITTKVEKDSGGTEPPEDPKWKKGLEIVERATIDTFTDRLKKKVINFLDKRLSPSENKKFVAEELNKNREIVGSQIFPSAVSNKTGEVTYAANLAGGETIYDKSLPNIIDRKNVIAYEKEKALREDGLVPINEAVDLLNQHGVKVRSQGEAGFSEKGATEMTAKGFGSLANTYKIDSIKSDGSRWYKLSDIKDKLLSIQRKNISTEEKVRTAKNILEQHPDIESWSQLNQMLETKGIKGFSNKMAEIYFPNLKAVTYHSKDFISSKKPAAILQGYRRRDIKEFGAPNVEKVLIAFKKHLGFGSGADAPSELMHVRPKEKATKTLYEPQDLLFGSKEENREYNQGLEKVRTEIKRSLDNIKLKYSPREYKENITIKVPSNLIRNYDFPEKMPIKKYIDKLNYMTTDLATATAGKIGGAVFDETLWDFKETEIGTDWSQVPGLGLSEEKLKELDSVFKKLKFERKGRNETGNLMIDEETGMPLVKDKYKLTKDEADTIILFLSNMLEQVTTGAESKPVSLGEMKEIWKRIPKKDGGLSGVDNYILNRYK